MVAAPCPLLVSRSSCLETANGISFGDEEEPLTITTVEGQGMIQENGNVSQGCFGPAVASNRRPARKQQNTSAR
jgi:hypothetical protein